MTFAQPHLLWLLTLPAVFLVITAFARARADRTRYPKIPRAQLDGSGIRPQARALRSRRPVFANLALALFISALARPQGAKITTPTFTQARDVLVAVDVSQSMLADDVPPNRLARARLLVRDLADTLRGERLGLIPFAGTAFLQSPLSADYEIFRTFLDELGPDMIPAGGTDFAALLRTAGEAFGPASAPDDPAIQQADRYLIILSDGEAENDAWRPLAKRLAERGVRIVSLGLGTTDGAMVPDGRGGFTKDERGAAVLSRLNPATLQELARATDGAYRDASSWVDLPALLAETVARGRAAKTVTETAPRREELFFWFLAPGLLLAALALVREFPSVPRVSTKSRRPPPLPAAVVRLLPLVLAVHGALLIVHSSFAEEPPPDPLLALVSRLAEQTEIPAADFRRLAELTATMGEQSHATPGTPAVPEGAIRDALAAVAAGQAADPRSADWPALRKRLEALLTPPPPQDQQQQQSTSDQNQPESQDQSPQKSDESNNESSSEQNEQADSQQNPDASSERKPSPSSKDEPGSSANSSSSGGSQNEGADNASSSAPRPAGEKPLGDLASSPKSDEQPNRDEQSPTAGDQSTESADEPMQQAGGISTSGRAGDASQEGDLALDPSLIVPQQRLERIRDADSPARLFQLLQESETPPSERERANARSKQTW